MAVREGVAGGCRVRGYNDVLAGALEATAIDSDRVALRARHAAAHRALQDAIE